MSSQIWIMPIPRYRAQAQGVPVEQPARRPRQFDLPFEGLRRLRVIVSDVCRRFRRRRPVPGLVYFGNRKQFVSIGGTVRRVEGA